MNRDPRMANASKAIAKLANECVEGTVEPAAVGLEIAIGLAEFASGHLPQGAAAAMLRECAATIDAPKDRSSFNPSDRELLELSDKGRQFIRTLQLAGIDENCAVSALTNASILTFARTRGAIGAAIWLQSLAQHTVLHAAAIDRIAQGS